MSADTPQPASAVPPDCPLCQTAGGDLVWTNGQARVVLVDDAGYPGYTRVILHEHVAEMSELTASQRAALMELVWLVEQTLCEVMQPDKVNLAALGNMVPHLHWHIIPRWRDDPNFPDAIWAPARRAAPQNPERAAALARYRVVLRAALETRDAAA